MAEATPIPEGVTMTRPAEIQFKEVDLDVVAEAPGKVVVFVDEDGKLDAGARKVNTLTRKALARFIGTLL